MLLIDACNIKSSGGVVLLKYLIKNIENKGIYYKVVVSKEIGIKTPHTIIFDRTYILSRNRFLKKEIDLHKPKVLLCFGSFPLLFKLKGVIVITFIQNALYTLNFNLFNFSIKDISLLLIKHTYIQLGKNYTNIFVFQNNFVELNYIKVFKLKKESCFTIPFFDDNLKLNTIPAICNIKKQNKNISYLYVSSSEPHKNHIVLLTSWEILLKNGLFPTLVLTIDPNSNYSKKILKKINYLNCLGANIINKGVLKHKDVLELVHEVDYCIYPSLAETLALGLLEMVILNKKVICTNNQYFNNLIKPSLCFDPNSAEDIYQKVKISMTKKLPNSEILIKNMINDFIELIIRKLDIK